MNCMLSSSLDCSSPKTMALSKAALTIQSFLQPLAKIMESPVLDDLHSVVYFVEKKITDMTQS